MKAQAAALRGAFGYIEGMNKVAPNTDKSSNIISGHC